MGESAHIATDKIMRNYVCLILEIERKDCERATSYVVNALREYVDAVEREVSRDFLEEKDPGLVYASSGRSQDMRMPCGVIIHQHAWTVGDEGQINNHKGK